MKNEQNDLDKSIYEMRRAFYKKLARRSDLGIHHNALGKSERDSGNQKIRVLASMSNEEKSINLFEKFYKIFRK